MTTIDNFSLTQDELVGDIIIPFALTGSYGEAFDDLLGYVGVATDFGTNVISVCAGGRRHTMSNLISM